MEFEQVTQVKIVMLAILTILTVITKWDLMKAIVPTVKVAASMRWYWTMEVAACLVQVRRKLLVKHVANMLARM